jgi:hypothetical protein
MLGGQDSIPHIVVNYKKCKEEMPIENQKKIFLIYFFINMHVQKKEKTIDFLQYAFIRQKNQQQGSANREAYI